MNVHTYNPKKVTCALGVHIVSGFADDSFIGVEYAGNGTATVSGADGEIVRSIDPSEVYNLKLVLQQTSKTNDYLQKMYEKDRDYGTGTFSVNINDLMGKNQVSAPIAWVVKPCSFVRGKEQQNKEWEITVAGAMFK